jgi:sulfoxide reductase catalytic subunit YedY
MPIKNFKTMGMTDHTVNLKQWRLQVVGAVQNPFELTYTQLLDLPIIERKVLLICPGIFTNHGHWEGFSDVTYFENKRILPYVLREILGEN